MPQGENFWNPYRWVTLGGEEALREKPNHHHRASGLSGRLRCELTALTPLMIGNGSGKFVHHASRSPQDASYIPGTSLKGAIRSLAEVVSHSEDPFNSTHPDASQLDIVARTFGYLQKGNVFRGLVRFSDACLMFTPDRGWQEYEVVAGQPKPNHQSFYPSKRQRKFYHHHPGTKDLVRAPSNIRQTSTVQPAPCGTSFAFTVDFENLREAELSLLLYCLVLEEQVQVNLRPQCLRPGDRHLVTFQGPMRHKIGGAKPHGAGSVHIAITHMHLQEDAAARYRGRDSSRIWEEESLRQELVHRTQAYSRREDQTMNELRAMLIYSEDDPRGQEIRYPAWNWFDRNPTTELKPTL
ncbi:MAG: RAMP superfamily CRISPR-associated protein [Caldilineaceae bacterium]|nr:RAMP superfamily CRISPR-associated protein [Caldilineaceae bacterium]